MNLPVKQAVILSLLLLFCASLFAEGPTHVPAALNRRKAMGGDHAALADDFSVFNANPAGFQEASRRLKEKGKLGIQFSEVTGRLNGPSLQLLKPIVQTSRNLEAITENLAALLTTSANMTLVGPVSFGILKQGLGLGIYDEIGMDLITRGLASTPYAAVYLNTILCGGYSFRLPLPERSGIEWDFGFMLKGFVRTESTLRKSILDLLSLIENPENPLDTQPIVFSLGGGFDAGMRVSFHDRFSIGIVGKDIFTPYVVNVYSNYQDAIDVLTTGSSAMASQNTARMPIELSGGVLIEPPLGRLGFHVTNFKIALDYHDIIGFATHPDTWQNPWLNIGAGIEFSVLDIIDLRLGFSEGMLSGGVGVDLTIFQYSMTVYGEEKSLEPGINPVYHVITGLTFSY